MRSTGLEPVTLCSEGRCSIQLSYERVKNLDPLCRFIAADVDLNPGLCGLVRGSKQTSRCGLIKILFAANGAYLSGHLFEYQGCLGPVPR